MKRINILHLTDFHFGLSSDGSSGESSKKVLGPDFVNEIRDYNIRNRFLVFIRRQALNNPIHVIAFTGDLGLGTTKDTLVLGVEYLEQLAKGINVSPEHVIVSPGNHDLDRMASDDNELDEFSSLCQKKGSHLPVELYLQ